MTIGIFQLQARGEQDEHLTGNPEVSFFKSVYRRHTNFSLQTEEIFFQNAIKWGQMTECIVPRKGDLVARTYLHVKLPILSTDETNTSARWVSNIGHALIKTAEIEIGGQRIDIQTGENLYVVNQLATNGGKRVGMDYMIGSDVDPTQEKNIFIPLYFWFNRADNAALPLIALNFQEVKIKIHIRDFNEITLGADIEIPLENISIIMDYILLDTNERNKLQVGKKSYLIEQTQMNTENKTEKAINVVELQFKNSVKEIYWMVRRFIKGDIGENNSKDWFNYTYKNNLNPIKNVTLKINGQEKIKELSGEYFNLVQPFQHHSNIPDNSGICSYSFALNPEMHQPSGTFNFSCVENAQLILELQDDYFQELKYQNKLIGEQEVSIQIYCNSYNILEIENGKATLLYA